MNKVIKNFRYTPDLYPFFQKYKIPDSKNIRRQSLLKIGDEGVEVEDLQQKLIKINYLKGTADGYFGKNTRRAVLNFQSDNNLITDGIVGEDTWAAINLKLDTPEIKEFQTVRLGDQNKYVSDLKFKLKRLDYYENTIEDNFDSKTQESVRKFQSDNNLTVDGIAGPSTWKILNSEYETFKNNLPVIINPLFEGSTGEEVRLLQENLRMLGYDDIETDGNFTSATENAVKKFQLENNINDTGIVNQETWELIEEKVEDLNRNIRFEELKEGSTGLDVITLQEKLRIVKDFFGSVTGSFGPSTTEAVKSFQSRNNLPVNGIVDSQTWDLLMSQTSGSIIDNLMAVPVVDTNNIQTTNVLNRPTLRLGDRGTEVSNLQRILKELMYYDGTIDGIFGNSTNVAVRTFQTNNRLTADGIVGRSTWSALIFLYSPLTVCGNDSPDEGSEEINYIGVVIDAGHGGSDPGAVSSQIIEKDINLQISRYMANRFSELGIPYSLTRETDETITNAERIRRIKQPFGDVENAIVVSNHINSGGGEGAEVIYALRNTPELATNILNEIGKAGQATRLVYQKSLPTNPSLDYYYIMRDTNNLETIIVEYGFLDNEKDINKLQRYWQNYAEAIVKAITEYMGYKYISQSTEGTYTVKAGDSLYSIARKFNTTVNEIKAANNLKSDVLPIGKNLIIPGDETETEIPQEGTYTVKAGDSLYSIARLFNTTVNEIKTANDLTSNILSIGQELIIPTKIMPPATTTNYIVKAGDSLYSIAREFDTTVNEIKTINNLTSNILSIGQGLKIPSINNEIPSPVLPTVYTVKAGDSLYSIARAFNTTVNEIAQNNNLKTDVLTIGQQLKMPTRVENIEQEDGIYIVKSGDTLWSIANKYNIHVDELKKINNLQSNNLSIGQELLVPFERNKDNETYIVEEGDSTWSIANKFYVTDESLRKLNNLENNFLEAGLTLNIPK